jgi:hypothetical protein
MKPIRCPRKDEPFQKTHLAARRNRKLGKT